MCIIDICLELPEPAVGRDLSTQWDREVVDLLVVDGAIGEVLKDAA